ncbi:CLUMA_CG003330, isoform A [Clunio marinus]|uniref:CLUMA_CG003330, isoform A n=1 Tax=Clunio marinus TaxID=568069 RepID=A0A1J1HNN7_9DIPT|nr:CLUMA_CG003330, isoform A [Clunio marinus]
MKLAKWSFKLFIFEITKETIESKKKDCNQNFNRKNEIRSNFSPKTEKAIVGMVSAKLKMNCKYSTVLSCPSTKGSSQLRPHWSSQAATLWQIIYYLNGGNIFRQLIYETQSVGQRKSGKIFFYVDSLKGFDAPETPSV